ncbi:MAG: ribonuclease P protein component [bacterium]|nr:ribonuclease P protein component [bacterium]
MLPAAHRIRTAADFHSTTRRGVKSSRGRVVAYVHRVADGLPPRAGVIASSSIGGSVIRHRATRRIRAALAGMLAELPDGTRVVVRALPGADREPLLPQQVRAAVVAASREARVAG